MLINYLINKKFVHIILTILISYYSAPIIMQLQLTVLAVYGVLIFIIVFLIKVEYAFYFLLLSRTLLDMGWGIQAGDVRITHMAGGLIGVIFIYYIVVVSKIKLLELLKLNINKVYLAFIVMALPAIFFSESQTEGIGRWFRLFQGFLVFNLTILVMQTVENGNYKKRMNLISSIIILAVVIPLILYYKNIFLGITVEGTGGIARHATFTAVYNVFSYYMLMVFAFILFRYSIEEKSGKKILWILVSVFIVYTIYSTHTRSVMLGLAFYLFLWTLYRKNYVITLIVLMAVPGIYISNPILQDRFKDFIDVFKGGDFFELNPWIGAGRIGIWQQNIKYFINQSTLIEKLFGNGYGLMLATARAGTPMAEHNNYLLLLISTGLCGFFMYFLYIFKLFQISFSLFKNTMDPYHQKLALIFIPFLFTYLLISFFEHPLWNLTFQYYFSVFAGFIVSASLIDSANKLQTQVI